MTLAKLSRELDQLMTQKKDNLPRAKSGDTASFSAGILAALAACLIAPELLSYLFSGKARLAEASNRHLNEATLTWDAIEVPKPFNHRFVEANPDVPQNAPDDTKNFSFRDQQAAQPEDSIPTSKDETPRIDSETNTQKIVPAGISGEPSEPLPVIPANSELAKNFKRGTPVGKDAEKADPAPNPADLETDAKAEGTQVKKIEKEGEDTETKRPIILAEVTPTDDLSPTPETSLKKITANKPRPRPRLASNLISAPLMRTTTSAPRVGKIAIECRLHPYGAYVQEMLQAIQDQWWQLARGSREFLQRDRLPQKITLRFLLDADGRISNLRRLDKEGDSVPSEICRQAISSRVPFGKWTAKMIEDFGGSDEVTINFLYR